MSRRRQIECAEVAVYWLSCWVAVGSEGIWTEESMIKRIGGDGKSIGEKETVAKNESVCVCDDGRIIPGTVAWNGKGRLNMVRHSIHASRDRQLADRSNNKISQKRGNNRWPRRS